MRYEVLGPLQVIGPEGPVPVPGRRAAAALCWLVVNANRPVAFTTVASVVWRQPTAGAKARMLLRSLAVTLPAGALEVDERARLVVPGDGVDVGRFERLVTEAHAQLRGGDSARAQANLDAALDLWRGDPFPELDHAPEVIGEIHRLAELRLDAVEERNALRLRDAVDYTVVAELRALVGLYPGRVRTRRQLALALYRTDRQIEALDVLRRMRGELSDEDGATARLQAAILAHDPELSMGEPTGV